MRRLMVCCLAFSLCLPLFAWNPKMRTFQQMAGEEWRIVSTYCRLDFQGARLTPEGWARIGNLTSFRDNPEFHSFFVISRYQLIENSAPSDDMEVAFVVIGRYDEGGGYVPVPSVVRNARFEMHDQNGELRITHIEPTTPFVSRASTIDWLKNKLTTQKDAADRRQIEASIQALESQNKPAPASK
jgi:hypothetical protein